MEPHGHKENLNLAKKECSVPVLNCNELSHYLRITIEKIHAIVENNKKKEDMKFIELEGSSYSANESWRMSYLKS